jgi:regulator of sirC expression with transglutaminase-like and TPR domain
MDKSLELSESQIKGFVNLLKDSEEKVLSLMAQQVSNMSPDSLKMIEDLAQKSNDVDLLDNWYHASRLSLKYMIEDWKRLHRQDLERGLFLISRIYTPYLNEQRYIEILDSYANRAAEKLSTKSTSDEAIEAINKVLFEEERFSGNQANYYDIRNNFIHTVIDTKLGNPIVLSSIYMLVAKRLKVPVSGIGAPGHFIVKFADQLIDPFFSGRRITKEECVIRAQELSVFWRDEYLDSIEDSFIIARCVRNLIAIYKRNNELDKASDVSELLKLI